MKITYTVFIFLIFHISYAQHWKDVGGGVSGGIGIEILKTDSIHNLLYAGGTFTAAGGINASKIASWDGSSWSKLGNSTFYGPGILAITFFNNDIIVGGDIDSIDNIKVNNVARWDGTNWHSMGEGFQDGNVYSLEVYNGILYAGGVFTHSGTKLVRYIAKWNGLSWDSVSYGVEGVVSEMISFEHKLYISGYFTDVRINDSTFMLCNTMVGWNDTNWISVDGGELHDVVTQFEIIHDTLYYTSHTQIRFQYGNIWQSLPFPIGGAQGWTIDIASYLNNLFVCGYFDNPPDLARYNGSSYDSVVSDVAGYISNLEVYNGELYVAGAFSSIDNLSFNSIARYNPYNGVDQLNPESRFMIYPIPCSDNNVVNITSTKPLRKIKISVSKPDGSVLSSDFYETFNNCKIEIDNLSSGVYFIYINSLTDDFPVEVFKIIK